MTHFGNAVGFERDIEGVLKVVRAEYNLNTEVKDTGQPVWGLTMKDIDSSVFFDGVGASGALT